MRTQHDGTPPFGDAGRRHVAEALAFIKRRFLDQDLSVERVAKEIGVHPNYLAGLFADCRHTRMAGEIALRRLTLAQELLRDPHRPIRQIARLCGYHSHTHFSMAFRLKTGMTPSQFRLLHQPPADHGLALGRGSALRSLGRDAHEHTRLTLYTSGKDRI